MRARYTVYIQPLAATMHKGGCDEDDVERHPINEGAMTLGTVRGAADGSVV